MLVRMWSIVVDVRYRRAKVIEPWIASKSKQHGRSDEKLKGIRVVSFFFIHATIFAPRVYLSFLSLSLSLLSLFRIGKISKLFRLHFGLAKSLPGVRAKGWREVKSDGTRGSCSSVEKNIYFDHGAVDRHLDDVEGVIVPATVIVEANLPRQSLDLHLKV